MSSKQRPAKRSSNAPKKIEKRAIPKSELDLQVNSTVNYSTLCVSEEINFKNVKLFVETPAKDQQALFVAKCEECCQLCDFSSKSSDRKAKDMKVLFLKQLISAFNIPHLVHTMQQQTMTSFFHMISVNLFRPFPKIYRNYVLDTKDSYQDSAWPHISLIYNCLTSSFNCAQAINELSLPFISRLVANCGSPDERERIVVRDILYSIYTKFMSVRDFVRQAIGLYFSNGNCSSELIQFFNSVASGFVSPLNPEHVTYYFKYIIPLHVLPDYPSYSKVLCECLKIYISKQMLILSPTILYLINHWPKSDRLKQSHFLSVLSEITTKFETHVSPKVAVDLFKLIGKCVIDLNTDIAEAALDIIFNKSFSMIIRTNSLLVFPSLIEKLYEASKGHWDDCIQNNALVALHHLSDIDSVCFNKIYSQHKLIKTQKAAAYGLLKNNWTKIYEAAKSIDRLVAPLNTDLLK